MSSFGLSSVKRSGQNSLLGVGGDPFEFMLSVSEGRKIEQARRSHLGHFCRWFVSGFWPAPKAGEPRASRIGMGSQNAHRSRQLAFLLVAFSPKVGSLPHKRERRPMSSLLGNPLLVSSKWENSFQKQQCRHPDPKGDCMARYGAERGISNEPANPDPFGCPCKVGG